MVGLLGSETKALAIAVLGLRGGCSGRRLARMIIKSPTQVFKALRQLVRDDLINYDEVGGVYYLNPRYPYYQELARMLNKWSTPLPSHFSFMPTIVPGRMVDPKSVYKILSVQEPLPCTARFSDVMREKYA